MTRARKEKRQHNNSAAEQRARVVKTGVYDGSHSTKEFVVSGHSTGSPNSEMEALSIQNSIDAGRVPDYPVDDYVPDLKNHGFGATADISGPELYGDHPVFTGDGDLPLSELQSQASSTGMTGDEFGAVNYNKVALWGSLGACTGALAFLAYRYYENRFPKPIFPPSV